MAGPLETLVELQSTLDELHRAEAQLAGVPDWMQELHAEHQVRKEKIDELVAVAEEAAGERRTEEALVLTRRALRAAERADAGEALSRWHWQLGRLLWSQGKADAALAAYGRAVRLVEAARQESLARYDEAPAYFRRAVALTILAQDPVGGLEVRCRGEQRWIRAEPPGDALTVNIGDLLELWSGGYLVSTLHRVVNTTGAQRYSFPYFAVPRYDTIVEPLRTRQPGFDREPVHVGDVSREVWLTNWPDAPPISAEVDPGTLESG